MLTNTPTLGKVITYDLIFKFHHDRVFYYWDNIVDFDRVIYPLTVVKTKIFGL